MSTDALLAEAQRLTRVDRARVAEELLSSLEESDVKSPLHGRRRWNVQKWLHTTTAVRIFIRTDRFITVISGTWWVNTGAKYDLDGMKPVPAGGFVTHFGKEIHDDGAKDTECILEIVGMYSTNGRKASVLNKLRASGVQGIGVSWDRLVGGDNPHGADARCSSPGQADPVLVIRPAADLTLPASPAGE